jgi:hypothetical protein
MPPRFPSPPPPFFPTRVGPEVYDPTVDHSKLWPRLHSQRFDLPRDQKPKPEVEGPYRRPSGPQHPRDRDWIWFAVVVTAAVAAVFVYRIS